MIKTSYGIQLILAAVSFGLLVIIRSFAEPKQMNQIEYAVAEVMQQLRLKQPLSSRQNQLWSTIRPFVTTIERLSIEAESVITTNRKYFDRDYINETLIFDIDDFVTDHPRLALAVLSNYLKLSTSAEITKINSLIILRKNFPKKFSIFYAYKFSKFSGLGLRRLSGQIISSQYDNCSLSKKFTEDYFKQLHVVSYPSIETP